MILIRTTCTTMHMVITISTDNRDTCVVAAVTTDVYQLLFNLSCKVPDMVHFYRYELGTCLNPVRSSGLELPIRTGVKNIVNKAC